MIELNLTRTEEKELERLEKEGDKKARIRAKAILMKWRVSNIDEIAKAVKKSDKTVYGWLKEFMEERLESLETKKCGGKKPALEPEDLEVIRDCMDDFPPGDSNSFNFNQLRNLFHCVFGTTSPPIELKTFKQFLRDNNITDYFEKRSQHLTDYYSKDTKKS